MMQRPLSPVYVALVHHPVYNKNRRVVRTCLTPLDLHDISRACRTYGVRAFYFITLLNSPAVHYRIWFPAACHNGHVDLVAENGCGHFRRHCSGIGAQREGRQVLGRQSDGWIPMLLQELPQGGKVDRRRGDDHLELRVGAVKFQELFQPAFRFGQGFV